MQLGNIKSLSVLCLFLALLPGCSRIPCCVCSSQLTPATYPRQECRCGTPLCQLCWQTFFSDPSLQRLICLALKYNRDLKGYCNCHAVNKLIEQVATTYLAAGELNELICFTQETIKAREEMYRIMKLRLVEGASSEYDFLQAETLLQLANAELVSLERRREMNWNAMTLLVGIPVCPEYQLLSEIESCFTTEICPGDPADLTCNRSDVRSALQGTCVDYEKAVQEAYREVADALAEHDWLSEQVCIQRELLKVQTERARLAWLRFEYSTGSFLEVLDAEREKFSAEQALVQTRRAWLASNVNLYIALGGGYCR